MVNRFSIDEIIEYAAMFFTSDRYSEDEKREFYLLVCEWYDENR